jgi:hypothetical protein
MPKSWGLLLIALIAEACTQKPAALPDAALPPDSGPLVVAPPGPAKRRATRAELEQALEQLSANVMKGATDPKNPWALAHGLAAFGKDLKASDGRLAIDVIVHDFVESKVEGGRTIWFFPLKSKDGTPVEPHPSMITKKMVEAGVPLSREFKLKKGTVTLEQLVRDREWEFKIPIDEPGWTKFAWSFTDFLKTREGQKNIVAAGGELDIDDLARRALSELEAEQAFLGDLMRQQRPDQLVKQRQGIYAHTCGGFHFIQAALLGAKRLGDPTNLERAKTQIDITRFRWDAERRLYEAMIRKQPEYRPILLVQQMKFFGHMLETYGFATQWGLVEPSPGHQEFVAEVAADLIDSTRELDSFFKKQDDLLKAAPQTYYDLIGDGCHAIRGMRLALEYYFKG